MTQAKKAKWLKPDGSPVACTEKIKVLEENLEELKVSLRDALEDALVMGCSEKSARDALHALVDEVRTDVRENPDAL